MKTLLWVEYTPSLKDTNCIPFIPCVHTGTYLKKNSLSVMDCSGPVPLSKLKIDAILNKENHMIKTYVYMALSYEGFVLSGMPRNWLDKWHVQNIWFASTYWKLCVNMTLMIIYCILMKGKFVSSKAHAPPLTRILSNQGSPLVVRLGSWTSKGTVHNFSNYWAPYFTERRHSIEIHDITL